MGAIVGVTAWSRGQEKLGGAINGGSPVVALTSRSGRPGPVQPVFPEL
jgi:hypothetical protein